MKRVLSVWMAAAKNLWWKLLLILLVMLAAEYGLYRWICPQLLEQGEHMARPFYAVMTHIHIKLVFFAAMAAVTSAPKDLSEKIRARITAIIETKPNSPNLALPAKSASLR